MAQAGSAQREPSMEEILASIRRIIEDSDLNRKPDDIGVKPDNDAEPKSSLAKPDFSSTDPSPEAQSKIIEVEAFRAELRTDQAIADSRKSVTLADVQAQVEAERAAAQAAAVDDYDQLLATFSAVEHASEDAPTPAPEVSLSLDAPSADTTRHDAWRLGVAAPAPVAEKPATVAMPEPVAAIPEPESTVAESSMRQPDPIGLEAVVAAWSSEPVRDDPPTMSEAEMLDLDLSDFDGLADVDGAATGEDTLSADYGLAATRPALISDQAGKKVAASFGELSEAFAARSRKNLDEVAEEMLRPMLQDWLDNNLPLMVERLVREEIERVARG